MSKRIKRLGKVKRTARGFEIIAFNDYNGEPCSLQESSLAIYVKPGTSAIWLGCDHNSTVQHSNGDFVSPRMHLDRNQVAALIRHLQSWLATDTFAHKP